MWSLFVFVVVGGTAGSPDVVSLWHKTRFDTPQACFAAFETEYDDLSEAVLKAVCHNQETGQNLILHPEALPTDATPQKLPRGR